MKIIEMTPRFPVLSSRDLEIWIGILATKLQGARIEKIFVPSQPAHPKGFHKRTLCWLLHQRSESFQLEVSLRPGECGIRILPPGTLKAAPQAPKSGFDLSITKHLVGQRIAKITQTCGDRMIRIDLSGSTSLSLHFHMIPGKPLGVLTESESGRVLQATDSRGTYSESPPRKLSAEEIDKIPFHPEWVCSMETYADLWQRSETQMLLKLRLVEIQKSLDSQIRNIDQKIQSLQTQLVATRNELDWSRCGIVLQTHLHESPEIRDGFYKLRDPLTDETILLPADPKLSIEEQLNRYYHLARRKKRRLVETDERIRNLSDKKHRLMTFKAKAEQAEVLEDLLEIESGLGMSSLTNESTRKRDDRRLADFEGHIFQSKEGLMILSGRNLAENLMLTFKVAKGNDLWLHVKGRPGSHTIILLPPKRTASLDTLLDAAHLCILHSGGRHWGKTEVDYTQRKYVKKIKNQTEVSYSQNKTLSIVLDEARMKRLKVSTDS